MLVTQAHIVVISLFYVYCFEFIVVVLYISLSCTVVSPYAIVHGSHTARTSAIEFAFLLPRRRSVQQKSATMRSLVGNCQLCWNPSLRHRRRASIRLAGYYGYSDTWAFVTKNLLTFYSHVDHTVEYINDVITMLVLHQLATKPIELSSCIRNLIS
jgi:hypothetical protein